MAEFTEILKRERIRRGLSLRAASARIGISHSYLASLENGSDPRSGSILVPSRETVNRIITAYELSPEDAAVCASYPGGSHGYLNEDFLVYAAKMIGNLKKTNPSKYRELLAIIEKE